ncbi:MAG: potassium-transporting ATPase subunit KdpC [Vicinamibacteria bacterium]
MYKEIKEGFLFTLVALVLFGVLYPLFVWGAGNVLFPGKAEGSFLRRADGSIVGSRLVGQAFTRPEYFHGRPSAVDYNAASTGGSNHGPSNPDHLKAVQERAAAISDSEDVPLDRIPSDLVTASGGGLDPHISPEAAFLQVDRVARERGVFPDRIRELVEAHIDGPSFGLFGRPRVNVLELNLALDEEAHP